MSRKSALPDNTTETPTTDVTKSRKSPVATEYKFYGKYDSNNIAVLIVVKLGRSAVSVFLVLYPNEKVMDLGNSDAIIAAYGAVLNTNKEDYTFLGSTPTFLSPADMATKFASILKPSELSEQPSV